MTGDTRSATISPWLSAADASGAVDFYKVAFGASELERVEDEHGGVAVAQLSLGAATFWVQQDDDSNPEALGGRSPVRMILTVEDPDAVFAQAIAAGAIQIAAIYEEHGWRVGRIADPAGHHWEIGKQVAT